MDLSHDILFRFFKGELGPESCDKLMSWAEESPENMAVLERERMLFDIINLSPALDARDFVSAKKTRSFLPWAIGAAAGLAAVISVSFFAFRQEGKEDIIAQTVVTAPAGENSDIFLPDGTEVRLKSGATLNYVQADIEKGIREVSLDGQAKFDVVKDAKHPFIVHTEMADVEVTGTSFDVISDDDDRIFELALFSGSVNVRPSDGRDTLLTVFPSQKLTLSDDGCSITEIKDFDAYKWVSGLYCFRDKSFASIVGDLAKYYGCDIRCEVGKDIAEQKLTGKFRISEGLDSALKALQISLDFKYNRDGASDVIIIATK